MPRQQKGSTMKPAIEFAPEAFDFGAMSSKSILPSSTIRISGVNILSPTRRKILKSTCLDAATGRLTRIRTESHSFRWPSNAEPREWTILLANPNNGFLCWQREERRKETSGFDGIEL